MHDCIFYFFIFDVIKTHWQWCKELVTHHILCYSLIWTQIRIYEPQHCIRKMIVNKYIRMSILRWFLATIWWKYLISQIIPKFFLYLTLMYEVLTSRLGNTFDSDYGKYDKFLIDKFNISLCLRIWWWL